MTLRLVVDRDAVAAVCRARGALSGRRVDLVRADAGRNPCFEAAANANAEELYAA